MLLVVTCPVHSQGPSGGGDWALMGDLDKGEQDKGEGKVKLGESSPSAHVHSPHRLVYVMEGLHPNSANI